MIGSIGGTLGLCIGFSFYDSMKIVVIQLVNGLLSMAGIGTDKDTRVETSNEHKHCVTKQEMEDLHMKMQHMKVELQSQINYNCEMKIQCLEGHE